MSRRTRLALAAPAALVAFALSASWATAAPPGTIMPDRSSSPAVPLVVAAGAPTGQTVTFTNSDKSKSTSALVATLTGTGFSKTADTCTGTALGPRKSCSVSVAYPGAAPSSAQTATLTVGPKKHASPAPVSAYFKAYSPAILDADPVHVDCAEDPAGCWQPAMSGSGLLPGAFANVQVHYSGALGMGDNVSPDGSLNTVWPLASFKCSDPPTFAFAESTAADGSPIYDTGDVSLACPPSS